MKPYFLPRSLSDVSFACVHSPGDRMKLLFVNEPHISQILQDYWERVGKNILKACHGKNGPGGKALAAKLDDLWWFLGLRCCKERFAPASCPLTSTCASEQAPSLTNVTSKIKTIIC